MLRLKAAPLRLHASGVFEELDSLVFRCLRHQYHIKVEGTLGFSGPSLSVPFSEMCSYVKKYMSKTIRPDRSGTRFTGKLNSTMRNRPFIKSTDRYL